MKPDDSIPIFGGKCARVTLATSNETEQQIDVYDCTTVLPAWVEDPLAS